MRVYIDTEFNGHQGQLMSIALVDENGRSFYCATGPITEPLTPWVEANVLPSLLGTRYVSQQYLASEIAQFLSAYESVHVIADWPTDIEHLMRVLITGPGERVDTPPLTMEVRRDIDARDSAVPHNALEDAKALRLMDLARRSNSILNNGAAGQPLPHQSQPTTNQEHPA